MPFLARKCAPVLRCLPVWVQASDRRVQVHRSFKEAHANNNNYMWGSEPVPHAPAHLRAYSGGEHPSRRTCPWR